jgi:hypothetical protein
MADLAVFNHGSLLLLRPLTEAAEAWLEENVHVEDWMRLGPYIAVEHRYVAPIVEGALEAGLVVE